MILHQTCTNISAFLSSTRLTVFLLILFGIASIAGTLIIQKGTSEARYINDSYSAGVVRLFDFLGLFDIYHSAIYATILILLAVNLVFCTIRRLIRHRTGSSVSLPLMPYHHIQRMAHQRIVRIEPGPAAALDRITGTIAGEGFSIRKRDDESLVAVRGQWSYRGSYICHFGFLLILTGGLISAIFSIEGMLWLKPLQSASYFSGPSEQEMPLEREIQCLQFTIERYPNGMVKEFRSDLRITGSEGAAEDKSLRVNHPLKLGRYRLYQSSYMTAGFESFVLRVQFPSGRREDINLLPQTGSHELTTESGTRLMIELMDFQPDFVRDASGQVTSRSSELNNPAVQLRLTESGKTPLSSWIFMRMPDFHGSHGDQGYQIQLVDVVPEYATGIQVAYDPGSILVWAGSFFLVGGLMVNLLVVPSTLWAAVKTDDQPGKAIIGVTFSRSTSLISRLLDRIEKNLTTKSSKSS